MINRFDLDRQSYFKGVRRLFSGFHRVWIWDESTRVYITEAGSLDEAIERRHDFILQIKRNHHDRQDPIALHDS